MVAPQLGDIVHYKFISICTCSPDFYFYTAMQCFTTSFYEQIQEPVLPGCFLRAKAIGLMPMIDQACILSLHLSFDRLSLVQLSEILTFFLNEG